MYPQSASFDYVYVLFQQRAMLLLGKKNSGWVGSSNAYNCLFTLHKYAIFGPILLIMWVGGLENGKKYAKSMAPKEL